MSIRFNDLAAEISSLYFQPDLEAWKILYAACYSHYYHPANTPPVWLLISGRQGGGKSDMVMTLKYLPTFYDIGNLTSKTLFSGFKQKGVSMALMSRVLAPPLLVMKDFGSVLTKNPFEKLEILNQLRMIYDGHHPADCGVGHVEWTGRCTFLTVCTPGQFEADRASFHTLGERFLDVQLRSPANEALSEYLLRRPQEPSKDRLARMVAQYITPAIKTPPRSPELPESLFQPLSQMVSLAAASRTPVKHCHHSNAIESVGEWESATRMSQGLKALLISAAAMEGKPSVGDDELALAIRVARECIPKFRLQVLEVIGDGRDQAAPDWDYGTIWRMPTTIRNRAIAELAAAGVIYQDGTMWRRTEQFSGTNLLLDPPSKGYRAMSILK